MNPENIKNKIHCSTKQKSRSISLNEWSHILSSKFVTPWLYIPVWMGDCRAQCWGLHCVPAGLHKKDCKTWQSCKAWATKETRKCCCWFRWEDRARILFHSPFLTLRPFFPPNENCWTHFPNRMGRWNMGQESHDIKLPSCWFWESGNLYVFKLHLFYSSGFQSRLRGSQLNITHIRFKGYNIKNICFCFLEKKIDSV